MLLDFHCSFIRSETGCEPAAHGTDDFACRGCDEVITSAPGDGVPWHWHKDFEAILAVSGSLLVLVPNEEIELAPGMAVFINSGCPHAVHSKGEGRLRSVIFSDFFVAGDEGSAIMSRYVRPLAHADGLKYVLFSPDDVDGGRAARNLKLAIDAIEAERPGFEIEARNRISQMLFEAWELAGSPAPVDAEECLDANRAELMRDFIAEHYAEKVTVGQIAAAGGVCERESLRCFTKEFGVSPSRYLMICRLNRASELLAGTDMDVAEIARMVGIPSPSNFSQLFRRDFNCTPRAFRSRARVQQPLQVP